MCHPLLPSRLLILVSPCCRATCRDGAGADGMATPQYTAYGATKAGIAHAYKSLQHETRGSGVAVHTLSPGMVLTPLLLEGATDENKSVFNILCEHPETSAAYLVPRARTVVARGSRGAYVRFLTLPRALARFLSAPFRANKFFDAEGALCRYLPRSSGCMHRQCSSLAKLPASSLLRMLLCAPLQAWLCTLLSGSASPQSARSGWPAGWHAARTSSAWPIASAWQPATSSSSQNGCPRPELRRSRAARPALHIWSAGACCTLYRYYF